MILEDAESWSDEDTEAVVEILRQHGSAFASNVAGALEEGLLEIVPGERIAALYDLKVIEAAGERPSGMHDGGTGRPEAIL